MEATALYDFNSTKPDELSFKKNSELLIISMQEYPHWFKARQNERQGMIPTNYIRMKPHPWYIRNCTRKEAEDRLLERLPNKDFLQPDGAFILRDSENHPGLFSISVKLDKGVLHFRVFLSTEGKYYVWSTTFKSINELIDHHRSTTIYGNKNTILRDFLPSKIFSNDNMNEPRTTTTTKELSYEPNNNISSSAKRNTGSTTTKPFINNNNTSGGIINHNNTTANNPEPTIINNNNGLVYDPNTPIPEGYTRQMAGKIVKTEFGFTAEYPEELGFEQGEEIMVLGEEDSNWWYGEIRSAYGPRRGLFPSNYVTIKDSKMRN